MQVRYRIEHYPGLFTQLRVQERVEGQSPRDLSTSDRMTLFEAESYAREGYRQRGVAWEPSREDFERGGHTLTGRWLTVLHEE